MLRPAIAVACGIAFSGAAFAADPTFNLSSPDIKGKPMIAEEQVFNGFGCSGKNISPALNWSAAPKGIKSFALLTHDPDAPTGGAGFMINANSIGKASFTGTYGRSK